MKLRHILLAAGFLLEPLAANAEPVDGFYVSLSGGWQYVSNLQETKAISNFTQTPGNVGLFCPSAGGSNNGPGSLFAIGASGQTGPCGPAFYKDGGAVAGAVGYGIGNTRLELEASYRLNGIDRLNNGYNTNFGLAYGGYEKKFAVMANVIHDFNFFAQGIGLPITPYVGVGVGVSTVNWSNVYRYGTNEVYPQYGTVSFITNVFNTTDTVLAVQGMAGASYDIPGVPGLALTADFRIFSLPQGFKENSVITFKWVPGSTNPATGKYYPVLSGPAASTFGSEFTYGVMVGLRYAFNRPAKAAEPVAPIVAAVPASPVSRSYLVFFDWDKSVLTDRAKQIVAEAAAASTKVQLTKIEVNGYTDTSGTPKYNEGLSVARAKAVSAELIKDGVPASAIAITGYGETHLLVPTANGVREPQNRRVEIILK